VTNKPVRITAIKIAVSSDTSDNGDAPALPTASASDEVFDAKSDHGVGWSRPLHRPVELPDGTTLNTLAEAGAHILDLPESIKRRDSWQRATDLLLKAASGAASVEDATAQIERALFMELTLLLLG
jgi:hypothetical protein